MLDKREQTIRLVLQESCINGVSKESTLFLVGQLCRINEWDIPSNTELKDILDSLVVEYLDKYTKEYKDSYKQISSRIKMFTYQFSV